MFGEPLLSKTNAEELPDIDKIYQRLQKKNRLDDEKERKTAHSKRATRAFHSTLRFFRSAAKN